QQREGRQVAYARLLPHVRAKAMFAAIFAANSSLSCEWVRSPLQEGVSLLDTETCRQQSWKQEGNFSNARALCDTLSPRNLCAGDGSAAFSGRVRATRACRQAAGSGRACHSELRGQCRLWRVPPGGVQ